MDTNRVKLPPSYEGHLLLQVDNGSREIDNDEHVQDPAGERRKHRVEYDSWESAFQGHIAWEPRHREAINGSVRLFTSNAAGSLIC
jgi:hypothetical protein